MFKDMKLSVKMTVMGAGIVVALGILGFIVFYSNSSVKKAISLNTEHTVQLELIQEFRENQLKLNMTAMDVIVDREKGEVAPEVKTIIDETTSFLSGNISKLNELADTDEKKEYSRKIAEITPLLIKGVGTDLVKLVESYKNPKVDLSKLEEEFVKIDDVIDHYGSSIDENIDALEKSIKTEQVETNKKLENTLSSSTILSIIIFVVSVVGIITVFILFSRSIVKALNNVIYGLSAGADQVASASRQVSASSQQLAEGASEQASSLEETSSSLEEISTMSRQNAENANQAKTMMQEARKIVEKVDAQMYGMVEATEKITKSSEETGKIIKTIDEIAFQTNLLALNAAVEAARAGEVGAGFAVVADEVRNLAMRAAEAAKNTASLIENTINAVRTGSEITNSTREAFKENADISEKIGKLVDEIAAASDEQALGLEQINIAITQMDKVTQATAASSEESASASEELTAQASELNTMVDKLVAIVGGSNINGNGTEREDTTYTRPTPRNSTPKISRNDHQPSPRALLKPKMKPNAKAVKPEDVIPLEEGEFEAF